MVLRRALGIVAVGLVFGLVFAWPLSNALGAFLFQVSPHDAVVYTLAAAVLFGAAFVAAIGPARRAASIDPIVALRAD
jgi:ABC-type antimicrobial peptide transport system permease subunit